MTLEQRAAEYATCNNNETIEENAYIAGYQAAIEDAAVAADDVAQAAFQRWKDDAAGPYAANRLRHVGWDSAAAIRKLGDA